MPHTRRHDERPAPRVSPGQRRGWFLLGFLLVVSLGVLLVMPWPGSDFDAYHRAAVRVSRGENPYRLDEFGIHGTYRYPPAFAYLMIPLGHLDVARAGRVWFVANVAALAGCVWLALCLVYGPRPWPAGTGAVALVTLYACSFYITQNLFQGQVALAMTLLCLGWAACRRGGRNFTGGLLMAGGCALKLAPAVLVPYLVLRKDWRGLAGVAVGGSLLVLTPAPWVGVDGAIELHRDWLRHAKETQVPVQNYRVGNQGFMGMLARLPHVSNGRVCYSDANLAALEYAYPLLIAALALGLYGWIGWDLRTRRGRLLAAEQERERDNRYLILLLLFMTLAHPCAWRCNFAPLILPCVVLARHAAQRRPGSRACRLTLILVALGWAWPLTQTLTEMAWSGVLLNGRVTLQDVFKARVEHRFWSPGIWLLQGAYFWTAVAVGGVCWRLSNQHLRGERGADG
jgi:hypothetical protein